VEVVARKPLARVAGALYLVVVVTGIFSLGYVPSRLEVPGDAAATLTNITASEPLYRLGVLAGCVCYVAFLVLPIVLYRLLAATNKHAGALMVAFVFASVPLSFVNLLHKANILALVSRPELRSLPIAQLHQQVAVSLASYSNGLLFLKIFWGLWLLPFGYLLFKSRFLPRVLGLLLMAGCFGYLINFVGTMLMPAYAQTAVSFYVSLPATVGEIGTCLWLLLVGAREPKLA
jgi:hypothetical protein